MGKRVLILHDDPGTRSEYCKILWYNGFDVEIADDPEQARRLAEVRAPDLVLLGISGTSTRGFELCRELGAHPGAPTIPVMLLSRHLDPDRARAARRAGCASYLEEPMPAVEVLFAVERLIGRSVPDEGVEPPPQRMPDPPAESPMARRAQDLPEPAQPTLQVIVEPPAPPPLHAVEAPPTQPASDVGPQSPPTQPAATGAPQAPQIQPSAAPPIQPSAPAAPPDPGRPEEPPRT